MTALTLVQISVVLLVSLACGRVATRFGQSRAIGEILGGLVLGPSLLGRLAPALESRLFPPASFHDLDVLSSTGLVLYLFLVGLHLEAGQLKQRRSAVLAISAMSMVAPFALSLMLAPSLYTRFAPDTIGRLPFVLFLGTAMSVTAFPVLARILDERKLTATPLGTLAILCAALNDVAAWLLLAFTLTLTTTSQHGVSLPVRLVCLLVYLAIMFLIVRPALTWAVRRRGKSPLPYEGLVLALVCLLLSAALTDWAGVHPLFGAFLAGVCFPAVPQWKAEMRDRLETLTSAVLLPLFFALTGLKTRFDLLNDGNTWMWEGLILGVAILGKAGGAALAARWCGQDWRSSFGLGALMNTRGLVELVVLNIAYSAGAFSATLFTMLVLMALITTVCTAPLLNVLKLRGEGQK